jgi:hypothetical protein
VRLLLFVALLLFAFYTPWGYFGLAGYYSYAVGRTR